MDIYYLSLDIYYLSLDIYYLSLDIYYLSSDDLDDGVLDIKLDITKKSRKINRPVSFGDQSG